MTIPSTAMITYRPPRLTRSTGRSTLVSSSRSMMWPADPQVPHHGCALSDSFGHLQHDTVESGVGFEFEA
ncbi:hypothetical protein MRX96_054570 [Rhipicephalus microplus]